MPKVVFYLHRVYPKGGIDDLSLKSFTKVLSLIESRFRIVPLYELLEGEGKGNLASITFDDGYFDNWVYAYPILKRKGLKAHLFITSGRIREDSTVRPNLFDYWDGKVSFSQLGNPTSMGNCHLRFFKEGDKREFLSWEELSLMGDVFTFGAHGLTHGKLPVAPDILDFYDGENFHWEYLSYGGELFLGKPRFKSKSSLYGRSFIPSSELLSLCKTFPKFKGWKSSLRDKLKEFRLGRFEEEAEAESRIEKELIESSRLIEEKLGVKVNTFSWPFGHYTSLSANIASKFYTYIFTTKRGVINGNATFTELPRVPLGKDLFTALGRVLTFSTPLYRIYRKVKKEKSL